MAGHLLCPHMDKTKSERKLSCLSSYCGTNPTMRALIISQRPPSSNNITRGVRASTYKFRVAITHSIPFDFHQFTLFFLVIFQDLLWESFVEKINYYKKFLDVVLTNSEPSYLLDVISKSFRLSAVFLLHCLQMEKLLSS